MDNQDLVVAKPDFKGDIQVKIKSLGEIESNMQDVKGYVENLNNYYRNVTFTDETMKQAKEEKQKVNKFKREVAEHRKNIVTEYSKPIKMFEELAKETEKLLTDTYDTINGQVANYENKKKKEIEQEVREYFEEYKTAKDIDFITYEQAKINVTLSASMKSLKEQVRAFIDKITDDLKLIDTQDHKAEILVEYKQTLNVSQAITTVTNRFKAIEEEKKKQEEKIVHIEMNENHEISKKSYEELESVMNKPLEQPEVEKQEDILTLRFTVRGTRTKLKALKEFLESGGYDYE